MLKLHGFWHVIILKCQLHRCDVVQSSEFGIAYYWQTGIGPREITDLILEQYHFEQDKDSNGLARLNVLETVRLLIPLLLILCNSCLPITVIVRIICS